MSKQGLLIFTSVSAITMLVGMMISNLMVEKSGLGLLSLSSLYIGCEMIFRNRVDLFAGSGMTKEDSLKRTKEEKSKTRLSTVVTGLTCILVAILIFVKGVILP